MQVPNFKQTSLYIYYYPSWHQYTISCLSRLGMSKSSRTQKQFNKYYYRRSQSKEQANPIIRVVLFLVVNNPTSTLSEEPMAAENDLEIS